MLDGSTLADDKVADHKSTEVETDIMALHVSRNIDAADTQNIAQQLRAKRLEGGAMTSTSMKIAFQVDDKGQPIDCDSYSKTKANSLVEEVW